MSSSPFASANVSHTPSFDQNQDSQNLDDLQIDLQALDMDEESESDDIFDTMQQEFAEAHQTLKTIRDFIRFGVSKLREHDVVVAQGTTDEFAEASAIVLQTLSLDWSADEQILDCRLTNSEKSEVLTLLQRRIVERKPLSYLINLSYFCDLPFYVDERVLIPRSPIAELIRQQFYPYFEPNNLVEKISGTTNDKKFHDHGLYDKQLAQPERMLDLCTGSGCIAIALASRFPDAMVDASDIDKNALEVAAVNVDHHHMNHQVNLIESNLFEKVPAENQYDLIVTNPPYVDAATMADLPPEFLHEPDHALAAGQDGLDLVHHILYNAPDYLTRDGLLVCEVGDSEWALRQAYPEIQFDWLTFAHGGHGIFAMYYDELMENRAYFEQYVTVS